ncbi:squamous cell carcinoma antigen recognized by T-cells 3-like [Xenia sp. Carnegie-2017]|uniref:squamous cell carcinoma antigen recognized by T-cells 3-like n=1 Tax=Xenia sp. Carnegie-2017 TaxID=2897299 RepID=UPI001F035925|nr:squamous cell carcinoma antigen recognized by T-cells 3-like [Xenia sp. Carnegie-2017]XP_046840831.1 squamous cell carcinoma antigen recognized by T-cells 3-like [Xenia sp. Carnegie-2017]XP_046840832.1 squamous cell carcinoma antigen recognized by T-cells 3-like [Xenia sp. Carnegie-2017]
MNMADDSTTEKAVMSDDVSHAECDVQMKMREENDDEVTSSDDEMPEDSQVTELREFLENSPFHYESHLKLIQALREIGDLDKTRQARETMSRMFPLTPEIWLEWIKDEMPLSCITEQKTYIHDLFEKAVQDYQSVKLWTEYCQFVMDNMDGEAGIEEARMVFERAITAVGLHVTEGAAIWDGYREFEMALCDSYQTIAEGSNGPQFQKKLSQQKEKVKTLFRREVSVPLIGMQAAYREYEQWLGDEGIQENIMREYKRAETKLEKCLPFEETLASAESPKLTEYREYIAFEMKENDLARVQCLYERAMLENCLNSEFWIEYTNYLDMKVSIIDVVLPVHERAVRNCPWVVTLWCSYIKALERTSQSQDKVQEVFDRGMNAMISNADDSILLWRCFLECLRRRVKDWKQENAERVDLMKAFDDATDYIKSNFGKDGDSQHFILRYKAYFEATKLDNISGAKKIWDFIMLHHNRESKFWVEYIQLLRQVQDNIGCRKLFNRAIQTSNDEPEKLCELYLKFEKEEGSLSDLDVAVNKCSERLKRVWAQKQKEYERSDATRQAEDEANAKKEKVKADKRTNKKAEEKLKIQKVKRKHEDIDDNDIKDEQPSAKRPFVSKDEKAPQLKHPTLATKEDKVHGSCKDHLKVFVSNLLFSVDEEQLKSVFSPLGEIEEIRLIKNLQGKSKGYAYVEFKHQSSVSAALATDRQQLCGRPMFVSQCVDKTQTPTTFRFSTTLDKTTVFVTNLPFEMNSTEIEDVFSEHGKVKQVRLVTNRAGKSKGYAYVEFEDESGAAAAVLKQDQKTVKNRVINVALSNPPKRERQETDVKHIRPDTGSRPGRARTQVQFVPRALKKTQVADSSEAHAILDSSVESKQSDKVKSGLSNDDFRKMLQK